MNMWCFSDQVGLRDMFEISLQHCLLKCIRQIPPADPVNLSCVLGYLDNDKLPHRQTIEVPILCCIPLHKANEITNVNEIARPTSLGEVILDECGTRCIW